MNKMYLPIARKNDLVVQELPDELLVYDLKKNKVFCLNQTAKLILEQCDGKTTFAEANENIRKNHKINIADEIFWIALKQLQKKGLLDEEEISLEIPTVSRRQIMKSGVAVGAALPLITSLAVPSAVNAQSVAACIQPGDPCSVFGGEMDNCCINASCTMEVGGVCCIIAQSPCDPTNDFCCPGTVCSTQTDLCVPIV